MLKALTFLGLGEYKDTTYIKHDDKQSMCKTDLFPQAVAELYQPNLLIAFITESVKIKKQVDITRLTEQLGGKFRTEDIPNGNSPEELWEIFETCAAAVDDRDEIILDITHAFRSIPLLVFIVAAYLRQVKQVTLKHIIYGAFEARDQNNQTPIFDLTPFVELLDWMNAVNVFQRSGDARPIADLDTHDNIGKVLTDMSEALLTNRTLEAQHAAFSFNQLNLLQNTPSQPPFGMLIKGLQDSYASSAVYEPRKHPLQSLKKQYEQIRWYIENQHYLQAITLIREWLISWECIQQNRGDWLSRDSRQRAENALGQRPEQQSSQLATGLASLASNATTTQLWAQCADIRNDLAHCGMRHKPQKAREAIRAINELFSKFEDFVNKNSA